MELAIYEQKSVISKGLELKTQANVNTTLGGDKIAIVIISQTYNVIAHLEEEEAMALRDGLDEHIRKIRDGQ